MGGDSLITTYVSLSRYSDLFSSEYSVGIPLQAGQVIKEKRMLCFLLAL